jgi:membrane fusion protein, copper/silver efflux system
MPPEGMMKYRSTAMREEMNVTEKPPVEACPPASSEKPRSRHWIIILPAIAAIFWLGSATGDSLAGAWHAFWHGNESDAAEAQGAHYYTCGMHPWVVLPKPGDCPICGMKLVPLDAAKFTGEVTINPVVAQNIGIRVTPVSKGPVTRTIRTVGTLTYDETRVRDVNIKVGGWIEKLHVDYLGSPVKKGQPLFEMYSPELYVAQAEYLQVWKDKGASASDELLNSMREKLAYFDVTLEQIRELEQKGAPSKTISILSPFDGVVIAKEAVEGMKVNAGTQVYRIADLSRIWVMVTLYEYQLPYVQVGQSATINLTYLPGQQFTGKVIYIYPYLSEKSRQIDVRMEFDNPNGELKPGMYASVDLNSTLANDRVMAPRSAIIDTGERKVAFVSMGEGRFEPRKIQVGAEAQNGMVEVLDGLKPGEKVVTSGQFLIDSEANVREALEKMIKGSLAADQQVSVALAGHSELNALPEPAAASLQRILNEYFRIQEDLATDSMSDVATQAGSIAKELDALIQTAIPEAPHFWHTHEEVATARGKALELSNAKSLEQARVHFADLSIALDKLLKATGVPPAFGQEVQELQCPMYRQGQGGTIWLQPAGAVRNPYYGKAMPGCFDQRKALPVTGKAKDTSGATAKNMAPAVATGGAGTPPLAMPAQFEALTQQYVQMQALLAGDQFEGVADLFGAIHATAARVDQNAAQPLADRLQLILKASAEKPEDLKQARAAFKTLSLALIGILKGAPKKNAAQATLYQFHCPMSNGDWLQNHAEISNPYFGNEMPKCGELVGTIGFAGAK